MNYNRCILLLPLCLFAMITLHAQDVHSGPRTKWTKEQAAAWYHSQPWLVGSNFIPSTAINQLEMWQAETFDTATIARELGWAAGLGMNTMRVFLHDLAFEEDPDGFINRIEIFLTIANRSGIRPLFVLFDSCWDPFPHTGKQHEPAPFLHNSGWVQSPGVDALKDENQYPRLKNYVIAIISHFNKDSRILAWDVWNEPDNSGGGSYERLQPYDKAQLVYGLLKQVFVWARSANPAQPLTSPIYQQEWLDSNKMTSMSRLVLSESDVISFHNYDRADGFEQCVKWLQQFGRPIICTEYMARGNGSTFQGDMPIAQKYHVAVYNWGFVSGKTQTIYPWDSWTKKYTGEPDLWFHDVLRGDGRPYSQSEAQFIRKMTGAVQPQKASQNATD